MESCPTYFRTGWTLLMAKRDLPQDTVELLNRLMPDEVVFNAYVSRLRDAGWSFRAIGDGFGVTNDTAKLRSIYGSSDAANGVSGQYEVPLPPLSKLEASKARAEARRENRYVIPADVIEELLELKRLAFKRGRHTGEDINQASSQFSALIWQEIQNGAEYSDLASILDITHQAIRFRLGRYGYIPLPPSLAHLAPADIEQLQDQAV